MDSERFDRIARTWATTSRRRVLAGLASTLGASLPLALGTTGADAKKKKPCPPCKRRKKGKCKGTLPDGTPCPGGSCQGGNCRPKLSACARACGSNCNYCVTTTPESTVICGDATSTASNRPCSSFVDCLGTGFDWCIATIEEVETGLVSPACDTADGCCGNVTACIV